MRHRRIPDDQANLRIRVHGPVLVRNVNLERMHRVFGKPVIPIEVTDGPDHFLESIHSRVVRGVEILVDVFEVHTPRISGLLEKAQNLDLDPPLLIDSSTVLQILNLLLELRPAAGFRVQPGVGNVRNRHTRLVKRIEKPAIAAAIRCCVTTG